MRPLAGDSATSTRAYEVTGNARALAVVVQCSSVVIDECGLNTRTGSRTVRAAALTAVGCSKQVAAVEAEDVGFSTEKTSDAGDRIELITDSYLINQASLSVSGALWTGNGVLDFAAIASCFNANKCSSVSGEPTLDALKVSNIRSSQCGSAVALHVENVGQPKQVIAIQLLGRSHL